MAVTRERGTHATRARTPMPTARASTQIARLEGMFAFYGQHYVALVWDAADGTVAMRTVQCGGNSYVAAPPQHTAAACECSDC